MAEQKFKFKAPSLEQSSDNNSFKSKLLSKSTLFVVLGMIASSTYYYFNEWQHITSFGVTDAVEGVFVGALIGYFLANNPCANNKC